MTENGDNSGTGVVETQTVRIDLPEEGFVLESGARLPELRVAYETYGALAKKRDNTIFICHALTGDAHVAGLHADGARTRGWWDSMVGPGRGIDTNHYHVVCANILGGCRGTTGPSSIDPRTGRPYGSAFPHFTVRDVVHVHLLLLKQLGIARLAALVGGSFGGMQVLEWVLHRPETVDRAVCIASAASLSAQALSFDIIGRKAITSDPNWQGGDYYRTGRAPVGGLDLARRIGHVTYLSPTMMDAKFGRFRNVETQAKDEGGSLFRSDFEVERYLEYQGEKFVKRFDANSYLYITEAMDEFAIGERGASLDTLFERVQSKMLIVALSSDWLFLPEQSRAIANALLRAGKAVSYCMLHAPQGHDAFLVDVEHLADIIRAFLPWVNETANTGGAAGTGRRPLFSTAKKPGTSAPPSSTRDGERAGAAAGSRCVTETRFVTRDSGARQAREREYACILNMVRPGSRVLDLGCGDGELLSRLASERQVAGIGVDIDIDNVIRVIDRGHDIFQEDIDAGLAMIPDNAYDYAILSETLQVVRKPRFVLHELLRVAREGIVAFPNFGRWAHRLYLGAAGRMPKGGALPFEWYDTPNIHLFTRNDFVDLCREDGIRILDTVCLPSGRVDSLLLRLGLCNAGAERILARITRAADARPARPRHFEKANPT